MNTRLNFASHGSTLTVATAALATVIALGILWGVAVLFQSKGAPMERLVAAEHACARYVYLSERQACMNEWLAASQPRIVALEASSTSTSPTKQ
jgi:hypothetical protein